MSIRLVPLRHASRPILRAWHGLTGRRLPGHGPTPGRREAPGTKRDSVKFILRRSLTTKLPSERSVFKEDHLWLNLEAECR